MSAKSNQKAKKQAKTKVSFKDLLTELLPLIKSFGLWIVLVIIVAWDYTNYRFFSMAFIYFTTYLTFGLAKIMFLQAAVLGAGTSMMTTIEVNYLSIVVNNYPMIIELECSAYHAYLALIALVLFSKWKPKQKLIAGSLMFVALAVINSLRIIILGIIGRKYPEAFNLMHDYVWNILLVVVIWGMWEFVNQKLIKKKHEAVS
jgi:exosortase/archaeosortase family protein